MKGRRSASLPERPEIPPLCQIIKSLGQAPDIAKIAGRVHLHTYDTPYWLFTECAGTREHPKVFVVNHNMFNLELTVVYALSLYEEGHQGSLASGFSSWEGMMQIESTRFETSGMLSSDDSKFNVKREDGRCMRDDVQTPGAERKKLQRRSSPRPIAGATDPITVGNKGASDSMRAADKKMQQREVLIELLGEGARSEKAKPPLNLN
ncbi:hypothetical protein AAG570_010735 [Ranatra chinensis]|uniref:Uncharacterized protein n=1 Tax=Ranatra chinensis TaxID=642074 RepID=A0ABD0YNE9_9HEMI